MSFLDGRKCSNASNNGDRNNGPEYRRHCKEEQKTSQFVGLCVREAESFADNQRGYLIDKFDQDNHPGPDPQPGRNLLNGYQFDSATRDEANIGHAVQDGTSLALGVQLPRKETIQHIADAA